VNVIHIYLNLKIRVEWFTWSLSYKCTLIKFAIPNSESGLFYISKIEFFSIAPCNVSLLIIFASFLVSVLCFFFDDFLSKVVALPHPQFKITF
jgi:hypothetical protein